ncbi:hypothetical protein HNQ91_001878 [Filimonas zeae]|uniref:YcxB-like protein n=1 Tax=Filimonas zeae TaxID=1737353 RepID=A0A917IYH5_9BACT|nr:hypothetical protein [Filimonas zeae]MDR6338827.1 hypothetical protein [Filimonas zeae]GGH66409.1 hypothetical protein GCM10011379_20570 [Filimonas zeae]
MSQSAFVFTLPQKRLRTYNVIADLMLLFSVAEFAMIIYHYPQTTPVMVYSILIAGIISFRVYSQIKKRKAHTLPAVAPAFGMAAAGWLYPGLGNVFVALLYVAAGLLEKKAKTPQQISFTTNNISITGFPEKKLEWATFSNVVLKDNLLTLDYRNNKLFQAEIPYNVSAEEESRFNAFAAAQLGR